MPEEIQDVNSESSTETVQTDVNQTVEETSTQSEQTITPSDAGQIQPVVEPVDETGVPWKNRAFEWQRKAQELSEKLPNIVEQKLQEVMQKQQQTTQPKYSIQELEAFAQANPTYRPWVEEQKEQLRIEKVTKAIDEKLSVSRKEQESQIRKQQEEQAVISKFPNMFKKNAFGGFEWNQADPQTELTSRIIANEPNLGLENASLKAYAILSMSGNKTVIKTQEQLKTQVKSLEKKTMVEGGGKQAPISTKTESREAIDRLAQTGSMKDAQNAVSAIFKTMGLIQE